MNKRKMIFTIALLIVGVFIGGFVTTKKISAKNSQHEEQLFQLADNVVAVCMEHTIELDRYEYATGAASGKKLVCFYSGDDTVHYALGNDAQNMELTQKACAYAYAKYQEEIQKNIYPEDGLSAAHATTKQFKMTNVYEDTAYVYDAITGMTDIIPANDQNSGITVETVFEANLLFKKIEIPNKQTWGFYSTKESEE